MKFRWCSLVATYRQAHLCFKYGTFLAPTTNVELVVITRRLSFIIYLPFIIINGAYQWSWARRVLYYTKMSFKFALTSRSLWGVFFFSLAFLTLQYISELLQNTNASSTRARLGYVWAQPCFKQAWTSLAELTRLCLFCFYSGIACHFCTWQWTCSYPTDGNGFFTFILRTYIEFWWLSVCVFFLCRAGIAGIILPVVLRSNWLRTPLKLWFPLDWLPLDTTM